MFDAFMLAFDANRVIGLRIARLMLGGKRSQREAKLMVTEKMAAAVEAAGKLMAGRRPCLSLSAARCVER